MISLNTHACHLPEKSKVRLNQIFFEQLLKISLTACVQLTSSYLDPLGGPLVPVIKPRWLPEQLSARGCPAQTSSAA